MGVEEYAAALRAGDGRQGPGLPPHYPTCFGCGPDAEAGLHLVAELDGTDVVTTYTFTDRHSGAPGIAHGGTVAALVDDLLGYLLFIAREPGVTRRLEIDYLLPVLVGVPYAVRARADRREGRKLFVSCRGTSPEGVVTFRATGLFVIVDISHFAIGGREGRGSVAL